jgi:regulator of replication initiation timing
MNQSQCDLLAEIYDLEQHIELLKGEIGSLELYITDLLSENHSLLLQLNKDKK